MDKSKFGLINARSLRNISLFLRNYVAECSLIETWLTDEDATSLSELCVEAFDAVEVSEFSSVKLSSSYPVSLSTPTPHKHSPSLCETLAPAANACNRDVPATKLMFLGLS